MTNSPLHCFQEIDAKLAVAQQPLQKLEQELKQFQAEHSSKISQVSRKAQELNSAVDRLENLTAPIDKYDIKQEPGGIM